MNYLFVACVSFLLVSFVAAEDKVPSFCTSNVTKCNLANISVKCVTDEDCTKFVAEGNADLTYAPANNMTKNEDKLKIVLSQRYGDVPEDFVLYYGLAVVKKETTFNFTQLKDKDSCHTAVGRTVGWTIPVGYLLYTKEMPLHKDQYKSVADFFKGTCAPVAGEIDASAEVKKALCSLCKGKCSTKDNPYAGYVGAFKCMSDGENRVGFVKQTTADQYLAKYPGAGSSKSDYKLLCTDGTTKPLDDFQSCNIDKRPAHAFVTSASKSDTDVESYRKLLKGANIEDLRRGGMVFNSTKRLVSYTGTIKKYLEPYSLHYREVQKKEDVNAASAVLVSFALQIVAIFAYTRLI